MANNPFAEAYGLLSKYEKLFVAKYGRSVVINKYREKWGMRDVIDTIGGKRALEVLEYYFRLDHPGHPLVWFYNNFDRLDVAERQAREEKEKRERLRKQTAEKVKSISKERAISL